MKTAFLKFSNWIKNHLPTKRRLIQVYAALLFNANLKGYISGRIYTGKTKYVCVPGMNCYSCPGAVGSCPLGSLQNALASSGNTAPYYVIGIIALFGLILGRTICGYLCPVGLGQELLYKLHTPKLKKSKFTRILSYLKYVLLIGFVIIIPIIYGQQGIAVPAFCKYICPAGTFGGGLGLLLNPNNQNYLHSLGPIFTWKFCLLMVIIAACVFCYRAFCRFLCPLGAIYGFFNRFAFIGVHVDDDDCTNCGLCVSHCKMDIKHVGDHECINCGECISVCPTKAISFKGSKLFLRRNEVDGATEQPVLMISSPENESAADGSVSDSNASDVPVPNACVPDNCASDSLTANDAQQATPRHIVKIDGYAGLAPMPALALESVGINAPTLAPDTGLPSGGNSQESPETDQKETTFDNDAENSTAFDNDEDTASSEDVSEATVSSEDVSDATVSSEETTASYKKREDTQNAALSDKNGQKTSNSDISAGAKLAAAVRTPKFWMKCTAVFLALALLIGAFVYFGLQEEVITVKIEVGAPCPDFSLDIYEWSGDSVSLTQNKFTLSEHKGEVVVINFWATWCGSCIAELPHFDLLKENYPDIAVVAVHGVSTDAPRGTPQEDYVSGVLMQKGWHNILFVQGELEGRECLTFRLLGGKDAWPMTLILDKDGKIAFIRQGQLEYDTLEAEATKLL